jgi:hypothetical protein
MIEEGVQALATPKPLERPFLAPRQPLRQRRQPRERQANRGNATTTPDEDEPARTAEAWAVLPGVPPMRTRIGSAHGTVIRYSLAFHEHRGVSPSCGSARHRPAGWSVSTGLKAPDRRRCSPPRGARGANAAPKTAPAVGGKPAGQRLTPQTELVGPKATRHRHRAGRTPIAFLCRLWHLGRVL